MSLNKIPIYIIHPARSTLHYRALVGWPKYKLIVMGFPASPWRPLAYLKLRRFFYTLVDHWQWLKLKYFLRDQIVIFSLEPLSPKIKYLLALQRRQRLIYQTSWSGWDSNSFLFSAPPKLRQVWIALLRQIEVVTVTRAVQKQLQNFINSNDNVSHIPHSVNYDLYKNRRLKKSGILFVGRFSIEKNFDFIKKIVEAFPRQKFTFIGYGNELEKINNYTNVSILNYIDQEEKLAEYFNRAKILILPSIYELFGMVLLEAMAAGVLVISAPNQGPREIVRSGQNGFLIPLDLGKWIKKIKACLQDDHSALTERAEKDIINNYDCPVVRRRWEKLWQQK